MITTSNQPPKGKKGKKEKSRKKEKGKDKTEISVWPGLSGFALSQPTLCKLPWPSYTPHPRNSQWKRTTAQTEGKKKTFPGEELADPTEAVPHWHKPHLEIRHYFFLGFKLKRKEVILPSATEAQL